MGISYKGHSVVASTVVIFIIGVNAKNYSLAFKNNKLAKMAKNNLAEQGYFIDYYQITTRFSGSSHMPSCSVTSNAL